jgi:hypothetical protein
MRNAEYAWWGRVGWSRHSVRGLVVVSLLIGLSLPGSSRSGSCESAVVVVGEGVRRSGWLVAAPRRERRHHGREVVQIL